VPLIVLATLALVGGWVGIPNALIPGGNRFEHFLAPVFEAAAGHETAVAEGAAALGGGEHALAGAASETVSGALHAAAGAHGGAMEYVLMLVSLGIACTGIALAHLFYVRRPEIPGALVERFQGVYRTLLNKYWVDELYAATVLRGVKGLSRGLARFDLRVIDGLVNGVAWLARLVSWFGGAIDRYIVDGAVNGVAWIVRSLGGQARRLQSGVVQSYVLAVFVGLAAIIVLMRLFH
jgi:NADH-quinone oxidoreductase subunit L